MKDNADEIGPLPGLARQAFVDCYGVAGLASRDAGAGGEIALDCVVDCKYP